MIDYIYQGQSWSTSFYLFRKKMQPYFLLRLGSKMNCYSFFQIILMMQCYIQLNFYQIQVLKVLLSSRFSEIQNIILELGQVVELQKLVEYIECFEHLIQYYNDVVDSESSIIANIWPFSSDSALFKKQLTPLAQLLFKQSRIEQRRMTAELF